MLLIVLACKLKTDWFSFLAELAIILFYLIDNNENPKFPFFYNNKII